MNFDAAFIRLLGHEGSYSDHKADTGGPTRHGVTQQVARNNGYQGDMRDFPVEQAKEIYRRQYWDAVRADELPDDVRFDVFDGAVNSGASQSIKWLQRAVGVTDDGALGRVTMGAVRVMPGYIVSARYNGHRLAFMTNLKNWDAFSRGWARRIASNLLGT